jgi:hypothetical protein
MLRAPRNRVARNFSKLQIAISFFPRADSSRDERGASDTLKAWAGVL